jgi:hypothetical protein
MHADFTPVIQTKQNDDTTQQQEMGCLMCGNFWCNSAI